MQIYYFTRTGRSKTIAQQLAERYKTVAWPIEDKKNWQGRVNYMKAAFAAMCGSAPIISYQRVVEGEPIAVVFPLWAGKLPPAVKTFVNAVGKEKIICVVTSLGSTLKDRQGFAKVIDLVGKSIEAPTKL